MENYAEIVRENCRGKRKLCGKHADILKTKKEILKNSKDGKKCRGKNHGRPLTAES